MYRWMTFDCIWWILLTRNVYLGLYTRKGFAYSYSTSPTLRVCSYRTRIMYTVYPATFKKSIQVTMMYYIFQHSWPDLHTGFRFEWLVCNIIAAGTRSNKPARTMYVQILSTIQNFSRGDFGTQAMPNHELSKVQRLLSWWHGSLPRIVVTVIHHTTHALKRCNVLGK